MKLYIPNPPKKLAMTILEPRSCADRELIQYGSGTSPVHSKVYIGTSDA